MIRQNDGGLPAEILFEFGPSRTYSLVYTYDLAAREVRWEARAGKRDAVSGFARFETADEGTNVTYGLEQTTPVDDVQAVLTAFVSWVKDARVR